MRPKDYVFALRLGELEKAWPLSTFEGGRVINDTLGDFEVVLIGEAATRTVRAYRAGRPHLYGIRDRARLGRRWRPILESRGRCVG